MQLLRPAGSSRNVGHLRVGRRWGCRWHFGPEHGLSSDTIRSLVPIHLSIVGASSILRSHRRVSSQNRCSSSVTSVGSTQGINPEVAAKFSSGGFSRIFSTPSYQDHAVNPFLQSLGRANAGQYNISGRAYPDVATQGANFYIHSAGQGYSFTGTSASSPTFASIIALINDRLLVSGRSPLGFLNPLLYSNATAAFNDITSGDNYDPVCGAGFKAGVGWDAVSTP